MASMAAIRYDEDAIRYKERIRSSAVVRTLISSGLVQSERAARVVIVLALLVVCLISGEYIVKNLGAARVSPVDTSAGSQIDQLKQAAQ